MVPNKTNALKKTGVTFDWHYDIWEDNVAGKHLWKRTTQFVAGNVLRFVSFSNSYS